MALGTIPTEAFALNLVLTSPSLPSVSTAPDFLAFVGFINGPSSSPSSSSNDSSFFPCFFFFFFNGCAPLPVSLPALSGVPVKEASGVDVPENAASRDSRSCCSRTSARRLRKSERATRPTVCVESRSLVVLFCGVNRDVLESDILWFSLEQLVE